MALLSGAAFAAVYARGPSSDSKAAQKGSRARVVSVELAKAELKSMPIDVDAIGTVTPIASVALKSRLDTTITAVHFEDGAKVSKDDILFTLDSRQIDAQIAQAEGVVAKSRASLVGAERDQRRFGDLIGKGATTQVSLDNANTQADVLRGTIEADQAALDNLKVQKTYTVIRAPISGRISAATVKVGNFVRPADVAPLATINQIAPIYVSFAVPQRVLVDLQAAVAASSSKVLATMPGDNQSEAGVVAMIENTVDTATGMVTVRAVMENAAERLWPGALVPTKLIIRNEQSVVVPSEAVQRSQTGDFVFVVKDGKARVQPVTVARTSEGRSMIATGLSGGEDVVVEGQLLLSDGTAVEARSRKAGA
ncbi:MAG TPA: efflux RND transporter periplasmic adaptor subunit [Xanthobacteraceae bacterium]|nr:efflux RND transporter periplasmic adaptor subunit [Xanthobacteraceae bacterium]